MTGYLHSLYPDVFREHGTPVLLPACEGWVIERAIPGYGEVDAMGCYPLFACRDWSALSCDLGAVDRNWVSLVMVTDPFGNYTVEQLHECFPDRVRLYKQHYVADLSRPREQYVCRKHRSKAKRALKAVNIDVCENPSDISHEWVGLYSELIQRRKIGGIAAFAAGSLVRNLEVPGLVAIRASIRERAVCILLIYVQGDVAYPHLQASSEEGYDANASFAVFWTAMEVLAGRGVRWLSLGAGAGIRDEGKSGLSRFKEGWASDMRATFLCGRIFRPAVYDRLVAEQNRPLDPEYFPLYRSGEFR